MTRRTLKADILRLRNEGKSYNQIVEILGCSKGSVAYYCSADTKLAMEEKRRQKEILEAGKPSKTCTKCEVSKQLKHFYAKPAMKDGLNSWCKDCVNAQNHGRLKRYRHNLKLTLMNELGGKCFDCGISGPPYMFDFDHRNPEEKSFTISQSRVANLALMLEEVKKCDLVCANCHRVRTHLQRCSGCEHCDERGVSPLADNE